MAVGKNFSVLFSQCQTFTAIANLLSCTSLWKGAGLPRYLWQLSAREDKRKIYYLLQRTWKFPIMTHYNLLLQLASQGPQAHVHFTAVQLLLTFPLLCSSLTFILYTYSGFPCTSWFGLGLWKSICVNFSMFWALGWAPRDPRAHLPQLG